MNDELITEISAEDLADLLRTENDCFWNVRVVEEFHETRKYKTIIFNTNNIFRTAETECYLCCRRVPTDLGDPTILEEDGYKIYKTPNAFDFYVWMKPDRLIDMDVINLLNMELSHSNACMIDNNIRIHSSLCMNEGVTKKFLLKKFFEWRSDWDNAYHNLIKAGCDAAMALVTVARFLQKHSERKDE